MREEKKEEGKSRKKKEEAPNGDGTGAPTNSSSIPLLQLPNVHASSIAGSSSSTNEDPEAATEEVEEEKPQMSVPLTIGLLVVVTVVRLLCSLPSQDHAKEAITC